MKRIRHTVLTGLICPVLAAIGCTVMAAAAPIDDAYRAYYDFLQDQI